MMKKIVLGISLVGTLVLLSAFYFEFDNIQNNFIFSILDFLGFNIFVFPIVLLLSMITYKMKEKVFYKWFKLSVWYLPLYFVFIFVLKNSPHGGSFAGVISEGFNVLLATIILFIYVIISGVLIFLENKN